jgi:hypothetical protein
VAGSGISGVRVLTRRVCGRFAGALALLLALPAPARAQEDAPGRDEALATADSIRAALVQPPGEPPSDWVDVAETPLKVVGFPLRLAFVTLPGWLASQITAPRPPGPLVRAYRAVDAWGARPAIRTSIGPRSAAALELQLHRWEPAYIHTAISRRGSQRHRAGVLLSGRRATFTAEARWQRDAQVPFYGVGSDTDRERGLYRRDYWDVRARGGFRPSRAWSFDLGAGFEDNRIGDPVWTDGTTLEEQFDTSQLYGATERTRYLRLDGGATLDLTGWKDFQDRGGWFRAQGGIYRGVGGTDSDFHFLTGIAQGYLPLNDRQQLALRGLASIVRADGGEGVPFFHLSKLGGAETALGYPSSRFTDNDMIALQAEWRYEVWRDIHNLVRSEFFLYFSEGAVAPRLQEIGRGDWQPSYGVGGRLAARERLLGVAYLGWSDEGVHVGLRGAWPL